jgi:hypothetical protein
MSDGINYNVGGGAGGRIQIEFILDPKTGLVESIKPIGVVGTQCQGLTAPFEARFGGQKVDEKLPEFYQQEVVKEQAKIGGGGYGI